MEILGKIGDVNPVDYDGGVIIDTGHGPQLFYYQNQGESDTVRVYRVFISDDMASDLAWVDWSALCKFLGGDEESEPIQDGFNGSIATKAQIYAYVAAYHGWANLDSDPVEMTRTEAEIHHDRIVGDHAAAS